jgi:hypothetical protein
VVVSGVQVVGRLEDDDVAGRDRVFLLFIQSAHPTMTGLPGISGRISKKDLLALFAGGA